MYVEIGGVDSLHDVADKLKEEYGEDITIEALTLVIKTEGWCMKAFTYSQGQGSLDEIV